jgi:hypothetical protein
MVVTFVVIILALIGGFVVCDAAFDDEDEPGDLGAPTWVMDREEDNENGRDCYQSEAPCSDDDFSPSFDKSPVEDSFNPTICLPFAKCGEEDAA